MTTISPGAALAAMRPLRVIACAVCGELFRARDSKAKFCSNRCKQADKYQRVKAHADSAAAPEAQ